MQHAESAQEFLSVSDVAAVLGVSVAQTYRLIAQGRLPGTRVAGVIRIPRAAWNQWLRSNTEAALANCAEAETRSRR